MSLLKELQRRNVIRVATAYIVVAWLVIQVVETIFPAFGFSDKAIRTVVVVFSIGFIPALIAAWVFELTPDGLKLDKEVDHSSVSSRKQSRLLDRTIIVFLVMGISYFAIDKFVLAPDRADEREAVVAEQAKAEAIVGYYGNRSIAVLPFVNMSSDSEQEYFAEGISEEILNLLARIRELRVISRSSAFALKGLNLEVADIAEKLGVAHILEGSVRKSGNTVRVTAQLIEARTDTHLWSKTYDRELENLFAIQDEIAADVAKNLQIRLLRPLPHSRVINPEVRAFTQQASAIQELRADNLGQNMKLLLDRALAIDPNYIPALELMIYADFFLEQDGVIGQEEAGERYEQVKERILSLEPENGFVDSADAWSAAYTDHDLEKAAALFESSIVKDPVDPNILRLAGVFAQNIGRIDEAARILKHATAIDPLCHQCLYRLGRAYLYGGRYHKAEAARTRYLALGGNGGHLHYSWIKLFQGDAKAAMKVFDGMSDDIQQTRSGRALAAYALGDTEFAQRTLNELADSPDHTGLVLASGLAAWMEHNDVAFKLLTELTGRFRRNLFGEIFSPIYRKLWDDPRWDEYRDSIGMSKERLDAIEFDVELPE